MTIEHSDIGTGEIHEPKGIATAMAGQTYRADGLGSGNWEFGEATNEVVVNSLSDFPTPVSGVITLAADTRYVIASSIATSNRFVLSNNTQVTSFSTLSPVFEYTGSGTMFTSVDATVIIQDIRLNCPNGQVFDSSDVAALNTNIFFCKDVIINSCNKIGTLTSLVSLVVTDTTAFNANSGWTIVGTGWRVWRMQDIGGISSSPTFIGVDMGTASCSGILFQTSLWTMVSGGIGFKGAAASANVPANNTGRISNMALPAAGTPLDGITRDDIRWVFQDNDQIQDTMPDAMVSLTGNATATTTPLNTPTLVAGTWVCERESLFSCTAAGRITYLGERPLTSPIDIVSTIEAVSGTNKDISVYVAINGTVVANSVKTNRVSSGDPKSTTVLWQRELNTNDYIEVFIENTSDSVNLLVKDAILRVR